MKMPGLEQGFYVRSFFLEANVWSKMHTGDLKVQKCFKFLISLGIKPKGPGVLFNISTAQWTA